MIEDSDKDYEAAVRTFKRIGVSLASSRCMSGGDALDLLHRRGKYLAVDDYRPA